MGFIQEFQAGSIVDELKKTLALKAVVLRDGQLYEVEAPDVVPGDILQVEEVSIIGLYVLCYTYYFSRALSFRQMVALSPTMLSSKSINLP